MLITCFRNFKCFHREYTTNQMEKLKTHLESVQTFKCSQCEYVTNLKSIMIKHMNTHISWINSNLYMNCIICICNRGVEILKF